MAIWSAKFQIDLFILTSLTVFIVTYFLFFWLCNSTRDWRRFRLCWKSPLISNHIIKRGIVDVCSYVCGKFARCLAGKQTRSCFLGYSGCIPVHRRRARVAQPMSDTSGNHSNVFPLYRSSSGTIIISRSKWHERHSSFFNSSPV